MHALRSLYQYTSSTLFSTTCSTTLDLLLSYPLHCLLRLIQMDFDPAVMPMPAHSMSGLSGSQGWFYNSDMMEKFDYPLDALVRAGIQRSWHVGSMAD